MTKQIEEKPFSADDVATLVAQYYNLKVIVKPLPGELDYNYYLQDNGGQKLLLKISNWEEQCKNLELQNELIKFLGRKQTFLKIPGLISSRFGKEIEVIKDQAERDRFVRLFTWVEGRPLATVNPHTPNLLLKLGIVCGCLCKSLTDFDHPAAHRFIKWDPSQAEWVKAHLNDFTEKQGDLVNYFYSLFETIALPKLPELRKSVNYNDANDYNVLVSYNLENPEIPGVIDFGDITYTHTINELAIAIAYGAMHKSDPLTAACHIVKGFNKEFELTDDELNVLFSLVCTRLLISVVCSRISQKERPQNSYLQISDQSAWDLLIQWKDVNPSLAHFRFREACGKEPCPLRANFNVWLLNKRFTNIIQPEVGDFSFKFFDQGVGSLELGGTENIESRKRLGAHISSLVSQNRMAVGIGRYNEIRPFYITDAYKEESDNGPVWRTVHIGLDVFMPESTEVLAPLDGVVYSVTNHVKGRNYGATIVLQHRVSADLTFYTLYGHLSESSLCKVKYGQKIKQGERVGEIGSSLECDNFPTHLHFQIMLDMLGNTWDFPRVIAPDQRRTWLSVCPDPGFLLGLGKDDNGTFLSEDIIAYRKKHLGKNLSVSYKTPLKMLRGMGEYLIDDRGKKFLDTVNNVAHVGHENSRVVKAGQRQMAVLNTNTRYLHDNIISFAEAILSTMPKRLSVVYVVNSGSEANELALRLAKNHTGAKDMIVVETGYHGNTNACVDISSYKFDGPGGKGALPHIHVVPMPDSFRGLYKLNETNAGKSYAVHIKNAVDRIQRDGRGIAGFICESVLSCGGQIPLPDGYLKAAYQYVRDSGGVCIADEVQTGCGRAGNYFWAFEEHNVVPDIVTIGKPIGNGHPLGVVVTTEAISDSFYNGMEYFNTFGGNPVSCAIGLEVLNVIRDEGLQQNASEIGTYLKSKLLDLKTQHPIIGDVRGPGLFIGIDLIDNIELLEPATKKASYLVNRMMESGILMSTDGPFNNVLKIKPPIIFNKQNADFLIDNLNRVLNEDFIKNSKQ